MLSFVSFICHNLNKWLDRKYESNKIRNMAIIKTHEKIQRVTERGQITLPASWRRKAGVGTSIVVKEKGGILEISPLHTEDERDEEWITIFDAMRDNRGKGIPAKKFAEIIRNIDRKKK